MSGQETWSMDRDEWRQLPEVKSGQKSRGQAFRAFTKMIWGLISYVGFDAMTKPWVET